MASTMQLEFAQAMSDFKTMFPDMDRDVIEAVLRANQGAVDATIDQLLAMSTDNQNEKLRNELDCGPRPADSPTRSLINLSEPDLLIATNDMTADTSVQLIDTSDSITTTTTSAIPHAGAGNTLLNISSASPHHQQTMNTGASPKQRSALSAVTATPSTPLKRGAATRKWNPPILGPLPPGFLRLQSSQIEATSRDFDLPDEQFAMMLQNEEFMNELRWNQDFMTALEKEQHDKSKTEDDAVFKERLKHMGKVSRKKFLQMARVFTWQRNKKTTSAKQIDSLPLKEEPSDDEEHQLHVRK